MEKQASISESNQRVEPFIPASKSIPEVTIKSLLLGIFLAIALAGSNAYLGLKMGQTISASIPAAVISMSILRLFRNSNILENNIVQTIASAGEVVAAGIIFTIPALIVMGYWDKFNYWQITIVGLIGSILGILYSIPLRRALIVESDLKYPEGLATAEVLKAGESQSKGQGVKFLVFGAVGASLLKFCQSGLHIFGETLSGWFRAGGAVFGFSSGLSLSMVGAGYIVGLNVAMNLFVGMIIAWFVAVPLYSFFGATPQEMGIGADASAFEYAMAIRSAKIRYIGVGGLVLGGLWALFSLVKPIKLAVSSSFEALAYSRQGIAAKPLRTEHDIPMTLVLLGVVILAVPMTYIFNQILGTANLGLGAMKYYIVLGFLTFVVLVIGFICASIGGYMAGIVGSSANPISGITIGAILIMSFLLVLVLGTDVEFGVATKETLSLSAMVILIGAVVAVCASFGCDNLQDLKSGQILGATPWKQQATLIVGAIAGGMVVAPIMELLYDAYGMGGVFPREGMDPSHALAAPQATLMASVAQGIFEQTLDWDLVLIGVGVSVAVLLLDQMILAKNKSSYRLSVLAVSLGIYLPMDVVLPLVTGGILSYCAKRAVEKQKAVLSESSYKALKKKTERHGLLFSAGMIAGDALIGILLAIPFAAYQDTNVLAVVDSGFNQTATVLGALVFAAFCYCLYMIGSRAKEKVQ